MVKLQRMMDVLMSEASTVFLSTCLQVFQGKHEDKHLSVLKVLFITNLSINYKTSKFCFWKVFLILFLGFF